MKILLAIANTDIAPRFDLTVEAIIAQVENGALAGEPRLLVLSEPSGDELCALAVSESVDLVVCGGIDEVHYEYLTWKKINVIEGVIGAYEQALGLLSSGTMTSNTILPGARH